MTTPAPSRPWPPWAKIAVFVGVGVFAVGLLVGFLPISAEGVKCGSAFVESDDATTADLMDTLGGGNLRTGQIGGVSAACDDRRSIIRIPAVALLAVGGLAAVAPVVARQTQQQQEPREGPPAA